MKKRNLSSLICCVVLGCLLISTGGYSESAIEGIQAKGDSLAHRKSDDYSQRQLNIRSHILKMFPGTYLDSMGIVIHLLSDSIRNGITTAKSKDSIAYLKTCLNNTFKDSALLERLSKLSLDGNGEKTGLNGAFTAHCISASNSAAVDSVAMDVFSGNTLIASAMSDSLGIIRLHTIASGTYSVVFSRRGYMPLSLMHVKIAATEPSYIDIPLNKQGSYLIQLLNNNNWLLLAAVALVLLLTISFSAYYLAKRRILKKNTVQK